jgi:hypothetical protein
MQVCDRKLKRLLVWAAVILTLALVFAAYLQPDMAMAWALQLWSCF